MTDKRIGKEPMMIPSPVRVEITGAIGTILLDRPERRNALNMAIKTQIAEAVIQLNANPQVRIIVLAGAGEYFVAGTDIGEMLDMDPSRHLALDTGAMFRAVRASTKMTIAAVEGYALGGGCELAMCCDLVVAGEGALFGQPEIRVGIMPGAGGTQNFVRALGRHRAMKLLLTGEPVSASDALAMGLVSDVVPKGQAREAAHALAQTILAMPPRGVAGIRKMVRQGPDMPIESALDMERDTFVLLFGGHDQQEGMQAFLEKRRPQYEGE